MKINMKSISFWLLAVICLFFGVSAHSEDLNQILNQISADLDKKKESESTNSIATKATKKPAQDATQEAPPAKKRHSPVASSETPL